MDFSGFLLFGDGKSRHGLSPVELGHHVRLAVLEVAVLPQIKAGQSPVQLRVVLDAVFAEAVERAGPGFAGAVGVHALGIRDDRGAVLHPRFVGAQGLARDQAVFDQHIRRHVHPPC